MLQSMGSQRVGHDFLRRTRGLDPSSKATLWLKAQHEGALPPPCIVRKDPRVPHRIARTVLKKQSKDGGIDFPISKLL